MSLDARLQKIARDEVQRALVGTSSAVTPQQDTELRQQAQDLHEHLHRALTLIDGLTKRVDALEETGAQQASDDADTSRATAPRRAKTRGIGT